MIADRKSALEAPPYKIFLDTNVVNKIVEYGEYFFDNHLDEEKLEVYSSIRSEDKEDIEALHDTLTAFKRICMSLYLSETTLTEIDNTREPNKRHHLLNYAGEVFVHWREWGAREVNLQFDDAKSFKALVEKEALSLNYLRDYADRKLLAEAIVLGCQVFLTMDRKTIWSKRSKVELKGLRILRPSELWKELQPWVGLWC